MSRKPDNKYFIWTWLHFTIQLLDLWNYLGDTLFNKMTAEIQQQTRKPTGNIGLAKVAVLCFG